jgi:pyruvate dehydrogenase (quinone)/pyruvate oxidase
LEGNYSKHKIPGHTSDAFVNINLSSDRQLLQKAAEVINSGNKVVILAGQGALIAGERVTAISEKIQAPIIKALLGKAVVPDEHPNCLGGIGMLGTSPSTEAMEEADTLFIIGSSFPYIEYLPKPGQARGIQIDIKPERIGLRYPVDFGLVGDSNRVLLELLPLLQAKSSDSIQAKFLKSKQEEMKKWNDLLLSQSNSSNSLESMNNGKKKIMMVTIITKILSNLKPLLLQYLNF